MSLPQMEKQPMTVRPFPLIRASKAGFQEDERQFTYHPTYGVEMGMTPGDPLKQAVFTRFTKECPLDSFPVPYYMIVLRGNLTVRTASGSSKAFGVGSMVHVADGEGKIQPAGALALVLLPNRLPHTISMPMLPKDEQETYHFVTLKVLPKGESGIEYGRGVRLDRKWGSGLQTSRTIDILAMSLCDAYPTLTAPLHPAYSKYLNWTTWLGPGRAEFGTSNGQTADVGAGDIVLFDDSEGQGHAYKVANNTQVKQVFITLNQEVTKWGTGPSGWEAGLEGRAWGEEKKAPKTKL